MGDLSTQYLPITMRTHIPAGIPMNSRPVGFRPNANAWRNISAPLSGRSRFALLHFAMAARWRIYYYCYYTTDLLQEWGKCEEWRVWGCSSPIAFGIAVGKRVLSSFAQMLSSWLSLRRFCLAFGWLLFLAPRT